MARPRDVGDAGPDDVRCGPIPGHFVSPEHETDTARFLDEMRARIRKQRLSRRELRLDDAEPREE
jgi:hypothetical protein